ncbi:PREDICTED: putative cyclin-A3-1 isoform X2 [Tarenaya hassleriana]|uniref:putative cyclin-A3-1 isoform X2 n=1 Tax=Tarenaya hassleriana TaxID=28532 RepID=UPI00053C69DE|nr:PREDICTED: putative cyclin-A3-1 isoform X2 [Tarenaya hassleriana]
MAEKEISGRMTRAAAKRKATMAAAKDDERASKKRVVLGELPNMSNVPVPVNPKPTQKPKRDLRAYAKQRKTASVSDTAKDSTAAVESSVDIDARTDDPQMCGPYVSDIYEYLRQLEVNPKQRPLPNYIEKVQKEVNSNMRGVLVDWLVEVSEEYKLVSHTLYLTVSYIDRFLSLKSVARQKLQLLGVSSMLIASKYEEISPQNVEDFCYITDNTYTKQEVVEMEAEILLALHFELGSPTIQTFLRRFARIAQEDIINVSHLQLEFLCSYLSELSLLDYKCVKFLPSMVAASAIFLARFIMRPKQHPWNPMLQEYTKYKPADLKECVGIIHDLYLSRRGGALQAVRAKYKQHRFKCVATLPVSPELPLLFFEDVMI